MAATFIAVALLISLLASRRSRLRREALIDQERMELLRTVAHDLRSPLHTIRSVSGDLLESELHAMTRRRLISLVHEESYRLEHIVGNLLSLSRLRAGAFVPETRPESVEEMVTGCVGRLDRLEPGRVLAMLDDDLPEVLVDRVQIDQVLVNLVDNAHRQSPAGAKVEISAVRDGAFVAITVDDQGTGFSSAQLRAPFEAFRSAHGSSGLGLTAAKAIVDAHGGTIALGVNAHGGARVTFHLPVAR